MKKRDLKGRFIKAYSKIDEWMLLKVIERAHQDSEEEARQYKISTENTFAIISLIWIYKMIEESRYYYLNGLCTIKILNIFHNEFGGYYVELFVDNYDSDVLKTLQDIFVSTYKPILSN